jgi:hypothetical protein
VKNKLFSRITFRRAGVPARFICLCAAACVVCVSAAGLAQAKDLSDGRTQAFLKKVAKDSFRYFWHEANPNNGLIKDSSDPYSPCSVAAVGFGLTAICIGESHGWITRDQAYRRVLKTLIALRDFVQHERGFFYHFVNMYDGKRAWLCEASSIDTAIAVAGALYAGEYFKGTEAEKIAGQIYRRVDWKWMLNGKSILCMGWKPEAGFLPHYWDSYSELILLYALAIGSPTHPIPKTCWEQWERPLADTKAGKVVYCTTGSIFTYQYSHAWIDFRKLIDEDVNYYDNSIKATILNRAFCIKKSKDFRTYGKDSWGLTASYGPWGYKGYGAKPGRPVHDGTVAPCAAAGSLPFAPRITIRALKHMYRQYKDSLYGRYGFFDAYNLDQNWWCDKYLGIDQGITVLMIENYLYGSVWTYFMKIPCIRKWIETCNLDKKGKQGANAFQNARKSS